MMLSNREIESRLAILEDLEETSDVELILLWAHINTPEWRMNKSSHWADVRSEIVDRGLLMIRPELKLQCFQEVIPIHLTIGLQDYCYPMD